MSRLIKALTQAEFLTSIWVGRVLVTDGTEGCRQKVVRCWPEGHDVLGRRSRGVGQKDACRRAEGCVCFEAGFCTFYAIQRDGLILSLLSIVLWHFATA